MEIVQCDASFVPAIRAILNDAIVSTTAVWDYRPRTKDEMQRWFAQKQAQRLPVLGLVEGGTLLGFATYGPFRAWPAYKYSVEHSLYVDAPHRRRGYGRRLLAALLERAAADDYHTVIGGIATENAASLELHEQLGFTRCGTIKHAGYKFDRWLDLTFVQRVLETPAVPRAE